ncbi:MAG: S4 domain-containing protein, partial [Ardenticatenales bacterium]
AALPEIEVPAAELDAGIPLFALLVRAGLADSSSDARRVVSERGAAVNGVVAADATALVTSSDLGDDGTIRLSRGKKRHALVRQGPAAA